jgi:flagellar protein FlgJ
VRDYVKFLQENPRYAAVLAAKTLEEQIAAMGKSGYATDPNYAAKLLAIAQKIKLDGMPTKAGPVTAGGSPYDPNAQPPSFMAQAPELDTRARGGHIKDLLALSRNYR